MRISTKTLTVALLAAWCAAIAVERGAASARQHRVALRAAQWIWAPGPWDWRASPVAFLAACDFDLPAPAPAARLLVQADEETLVYVNGRLVASSDHVDGGGLDWVPLGDRVRAGGNRVILELRSGRGAGGLLAAIEPGNGAAEVCPTGPGWRIYPERFPGLFEGWAVLATGDAGHAPRVWGAPPIGRWGTPHLGRELPRWDLELAGVPSRPPARVRTPGSQDWRAVGADGRVRGGAGSDATLDWGEEVAGILRLVLRDREGPRQAGPRAIGSDAGATAAFVEFSAAPPAANVIVPIALVTGTRSWRDSRPRRFRFARLVGDAEVLKAELLPVAPELMPPPPPAPPGVLGLEPPPLRLPVETEIRRRREARTSPETRP